MNKNKPTFDQLSIKQKVIVGNRKILLREGTIFNLPNDATKDKNYQEKYPLHYFAIKMSENDNDMQILKKMVSSFNKDIFNKNDIQGLNLLIIAIGMRKFKALEMMMNLGADTSVFNRKIHVTPLGYAAYAGFSQALFVMLKKGADPFLKIENSTAFTIKIRNSTLMHRVAWAVKPSAKEVVSILFPYYPDLYLENGEGQTIVDALRMNPYTTDIIQKELNCRSKALEINLGNIANHTKLHTKKINRL